VSLCDEGISRDLAEESFASRRQPRKIAKSSLNWSEKLTARLERVKVYTQGNVIRSCVRSQSVGSNSNLSVDCKKFIS